MKKSRVKFSLVLALLSLAMGSKAQEPQALPIADQRYRQTFCSWGAAG